MIRIDPDLLLEHDGVEVFHQHDEWGPNPYWFTTDPDNADEVKGHANEGQFDARRYAPQLFGAQWEGTPNVQQWEDWWTPRHLSERAAVEVIVIAAIDAGLIKPKANSSDMKRSALERRV